MRGGETPASGIGAEVEAGDRPKRTLPAPITSARRFRRARIFAVIAFALVLSAPVR